MRKTINLFTFLDGKILGQTWAYVKSFKRIMEVGRGGIAE
jgi:hypothetical protein